MTLQLKVGDTFTFENFIDFKDDIILINPTYGNNEVRANEKIIELNGLLIENVDLIKVDTSDGFVVVDLVNSIGKRICRKVMKWTETLEVSCMCGVPIYKFLS